MFKPCHLQNYYSCIISRQFLEGGHASKHLHYSVDKCGDRVIQTVCKVTGRGVIASTDIC
jgi:hypothetical protein